MIFSLAALVSTFYFMSHFLENRRYVVFKTILDKIYWHTAQNKVKYRMSGVTKYCISIEITSIWKSPFMHASHIMPGTNKAHMTRVGQTNPHILRSKYQKLKLKLLCFESTKSTFIYLWLSILSHKQGKMSNYYVHDCL